MKVAISSHFAWGQAGPSAFIDWEKRLNVEERLQAFGDDILGDSIDPQTGAITFSHTDVSLPGNNSLEVAIRRKKSQGYYFDENTEVEFSDWQIDVPRLSVVSVIQSPWDFQRCTQDFEELFPTHNNVGTTSVPGNSHVVASYDAHRGEYSNGVRLSVTGEKLLEKPTGVQWGSDAKFVTTSGWKFTCDTVSGDVLGHAPNGDKYHFDHYYIKGYERFGSLGGPQIYSRRRNILAASKVEDKHGNYVNYTYDNLNRLKRIESNDGRRIDLAYTGTSNLIDSVTANPETPASRTWQYSYEVNSFNNSHEITIHGYSVDKKVLKTVTLPDGRSWEFSLVGMYAPPSQATFCPQFSQTLEVEHPSGTKGEFFLDRVEMRDSLNALEAIFDFCFDEDITPDRQTRFRVRRLRLMSVFRKKLIVPGRADAVWRFSYEADLGDIGSSAHDQTNWSKIVDPEGNEETFYHIWSFEDLGGKLMKKEYRDSSGTLLRTEVNTYVQEEDIGRALLGNNYTTKTVHRPTHLATTIITQEGQDYTTVNSYNTDHDSADYSYGRPVTVSRSSNLLNSPKTRTIVTTYEHNRSKWILGLPTRVVENDIEMSTYTYDSLGRKKAQTRFGQAYATFGYHTNNNYKGAPHWIEDELGRRTEVSDWKRGTPQHIRKAAGTPVETNEYQYVDDNGWPSSIIDAKGQETSYSNDSMGRLKRIDPPGAFWSDTTITYDFTDGVSQTITRGAARTTVTYDTMYRPVLVKTEDTSGGGLTTYINTEYDGLGRAIFTSRPSTSASSINGTRTTYDGLGRVTQTLDTAINTPITSTEYLSGNRMRVTDALGNVTTTTRSGYGSPNDGNPTLIAQPEGINTAMTYDLFGNLLSARQYGNSGGFNIGKTQFWFYDDELRLCRSYTPETNSTIYDYDKVDNVIGVVKGQPANNCDLPNSADKITTTYDALNRPINVDYGSGNPNIDYSYDANGNVTGIEGGSGHGFELS